MPTIQEYNNDFSEELQDIITDVPSWLVRWGISIFFTILVIFVVAAAFIPAPDILKATAVIENKQPPQAVVAGSSGKLVNLLVRETQQVDSGSVLGFLQSTAQHRDILALSEKIDTMLAYAASKDFKTLGTFNLASVRHLGELQGSYQVFLEKFISFSAFLESGLLAKQHQSMKNEIHNLKAQNLQASKQLQLQEDDYRLQKENYDAYKKLFDKKLISSQEYRYAESRLINSEMPVQQTRSAILANRSQMEQIQSKMLTLENEVNERKASYLSVINNFKSELDQWKRKYVLTASISGTVVFHKRLVQGQWLTADEPALFIEPNRISEYIGRLHIDQFSLGKVREGQRVLLKVRAYPYQEFGLLHGRIDYLSDINFSDSLYSAKITLINGNNTSYKRKIQLKNGLIANAEVITEKRNLLNKLFDNVYSLFKNR
ncbi:MULTISPECIES: HlyD family secretion protein [Olivibacter]|jgi:HlyD family secretion protein|uniref:HlyD family secretion protein n=1 Tax=Olivibacter oleidegradans TaxID=760123 RepID=A0ABV6HQ48_9SPHI|nr:MULTISPECIES: HlyD family efflux transporter periplasmic adaptor subunit [unclassified Olivibacter]MDM8173688.1 HlyD family efflux transporter periplasmic adaptor subunit [Olivibacter sp. 47]MDX3914863.1 HlyD family efflux transporter periplasmic adaptor subunit [Pseudosphingobacterium sp.]QEL03482.1 HlyD family efflux transporter periplasmic adaptor subunit [Olivibacter sp. LS-1]